MSRIVAYLIRVYAFVRKEIINVLRQPRLVFSIILGPFIILLLFGIGYREQVRPLRTLFVVAEGSPMTPIVEDYAGRLGAQIDPQGITTDAAEADRRLRAQEIDLVVVVPPDPATQLRNNAQSTFQFYHYEIDPYERTYIEILGRNYIEEINRQVLLTAADQGKTEASALRENLGTAREAAATTRIALEAGDESAAGLSAEQLDAELALLSLAAGSGLAVLSGLDNTLGAQTLPAQLETMQSEAAALRSDTAAPIAERAARVATLEADLAEMDALLGRYTSLDSQVLISPFVSETLSVTDVSLGPTDFFVPAVIALLLQHIAVTLAGLSIVRERQDGPMELFRASPVSSFQTLIGKFLGYLILTAFIAVVLTALVIFGLGVPMLGNWGHYALVILALLCASLSFGFFISLMARTDSQAIQYAMIMLLASIFFSGFFLALYRLWEPVRAVSWALPVTYGIDMLQSVMLRGRAPSVILIVALFALAFVLFVFDWWRLNRIMARQ